MQQRNIVPRIHVGDDFLLTTAPKAYQGADPFPNEKFMDPWWSIDGGMTWPQINDFRDIPGNATAVLNDAKDRIAHIDAMIQAADPTKVPVDNPLSLPTKAAAYAADMNDKYAKNAGETLKHSAQYKGLQYAASALSTYLAGPVAGAVTGWWLDTATGWGASILKGLNDIGFKIGPAKDIERATQNMDLMVGCFSDTLIAALPPAWQTPGLPIIIGGDNASDQYIKDVVCHNLFKFQNMPLEDRDVVTQWWALYLAQANDPEIATTFSVLWNSSAFADDTQVVLVAMVIAKMAGLPWRPFAEQLWEKSKGWRGRPDLLRMWSGDTIVGLTAGSTPINASNVQWQVLASDAFKLAGIAPGDTAVSNGKSSVTSVVVPVVLGGGSAVAGFMLGGPIGAVIGGGLGWFLGSKF